MARQRERQDSDQTPWQKFESLHRRHPQLTTNTLYALPETLIRTLQEHLPNLWSAADLRFEVDLSRLAGGGFFYKRPFPFPLASTLPGADLQTRSGPPPSEVLKILTKLGMTEQQIHSFFAAQAKHDEAAQLRAVAFTAWLLTNKTFREEWALYIEDWQEEIAATGRFPLRLDSLTGERFDSEDPEEEQMLNFFSRWSLRSFLTWDLPMPMVPQLSGIVRGRPLDLADGGLLIFLPWHLLRDQSLSLKDLSEELITVAKPDHLKEWLVRGNTGNKRMGYKRLRHTLALYIFLVRGLDVRYPDKLPGNIERIDQAFADYLERDVDSIKKIRNSLYKDLSLLDSPPPA